MWSPAPRPQKQSPEPRSPLKLTEPLCAAAAKLLQSCPTLCDSIDSSPPGSCPWDSPGKNTGVDCHFLLQCMNVKSESEVSQSCLTLCDPIDCSLPGSSIHGIFQARVLEWGAIAFSEPLCNHGQKRPLPPLPLIITSRLPDPELGKNAHLGSHPIAP